MNSKYIVPWILGSTLFESLVQKIEWLLCAAAGRLKRSVRFPLYRGVLYKVAARLYEVLALSLWFGARFFVCLIRDEKHEVR